MNFTKFLRTSFLKEQLWWQHLNWIVPGVAWFVGVLVAWVKKLLRPNGLLESINYWS